MSLRAIEWEARVWRVARERLARRPKLQAEYSRRRWTRVLEMLALLLAGLSLPIPVFAVAVQMARAVQFPGGRIDDGTALVSAGVLLASYLFAGIWRAAARTDAIWTILQTQPFSDAVLARHWMWWRVGFAIVFFAPIAVFHAIVLDRFGQGWNAALSWGTVLGVADLTTVITTTLLFAVAVGHRFHSSLRVLFLGKLLVVLTLISIAPIQWLPRGGLAFAGRRLLWWPTGWPLAAFEAVMQGDAVRAIWWLVAVAVWFGIGLAAATVLIRQCAVREFGVSRIGSQLWPLFERESVWGPVEPEGPRGPSKFEQALGSGQPAPMIDFMKLDTRDEPLSVEDARTEVLRGEFLQPLPDDQLGWLEKVLLLSFWGRERTVAEGLMCDGRYWTRAVKAWWICAWFTVIWFGCGGLLRNGPAPPVWVMIPLVMLSISLIVMTAILTCWTIFSGWPGLIWVNQANKGLPLFAHLPISSQELAALRQRVILLKLLIVLLVSAPIFVALAWANNAAVWPVFKVLGKLAFALFVGQSWWFIGWQLSGSFFRTLRFYVTTILLLLGYIVLMVFLLAGDDYLEWAAPSMVLCAKLMSWVLNRTLDRPVFDLIGANMSQTNRSFSLSLDTQKA